MNDFFQTMRDMPLAGVALVAVMMAAGFLLWAAGRKVLRGAFVVIGLLLGGMIGLVLGSAVNFGVSPWIIAGIGACGLAALSGWAFRIAVAISLVLIFAIASPLLVVTLSQAKDQNGALSSLFESQREGSGRLDDFAAQAFGDAGSAATTQAAVAATRKSLDEAFDRTEATVNGSLGLQSGEDNQVSQLRAHVDRVINQGKEQWRNTPSSLRPTIVFSSIGGGALGLLVGLAMHGFAAALVTALGGSLLWLAGLRIMAARIGLDGAWMPNSGAAWLGAWMGAAIIGLFLQWIFRGKTADKTE